MNDFLIFAIVAIVIYLMVDRILVFRADRTNRKSLDAKLTQHDDRIKWLMDHHCHFEQTIKNDIVKINDRIATKARARRS